MPRKLRETIIAPEKIYHIVCRGINQKRIFREVRDYKKILEIIKKAKKSYNFYLYSYNLLSNHFHLFIETNDISVSKIMHYINGCYAGYFNYRHKRNGHLFQDRFYASLIDTESYFWTASAYIDLNAVRAGLVENPEDYPWSSYKFYFRGNFNDNLLDIRRFLLLNGNGDIREINQEYLSFVKEERKNKKMPRFIENDKYF